MLLWSPVLCLRSRASGRMRVCHLQEVPDQWARSSNPSIRLCTELICTKLLLFNGSPESRGINSNRKGKGRLKSKVNRYHSFQAIAMVGYPGMPIVCLRSGSEFPEFRQCSLDPNHASFCRDWMVWSMLGKKEKVAVCCFLLRANFGTICPVVGKKTRSNYHNIDMTLLSSITVLAR